MNTIALAQKLTVEGLSAALLASGLVAVSEVMGVEVILEDASQPFAVPSTVAGKVGVDYLTPHCGKKIRFSPSPVRAFPLIHEKVHISSRFTHAPGSLIVS